MPGITDPTEAYFKDGQWGWDGTRWRKLPMVWGYSDRYFEDLGGTKSGDGTYSSYGTPVPEGEVWVVQGLYISNESGARGYASLFLYVGASGYFLYNNQTPARYEHMRWDGALVLKAGDKARIFQLSCLDGDTINGGVWGYKMKVAE